MPPSTFTPRRSLTSYAKVQAWIGAVIRNRRFQLQRPRVRQTRYLDVGCGPNTHQNFINLDYFWCPGVDVCWDIRRGLPFGDASMTGVFSEHCLEHFSLEPGAALLREMRRVLAPGGVLRLVVPDGGLYLTTYTSQLAGGLQRPFPFETSERTNPLWTPMLSVNRIFYQDRDSAFGHRIIYDFQLLAVLLRQCGFQNVTQRSFGVGHDHALLIDTPDRQCESLYVEAGI